MNTVLIPSLVAAKDVDSYNGSFIAATDIQNGSVFQKGALNATNSQVYEIVKPVTGKLNDLWMAFSPEDTIIKTANGNEYKPGLLDPRQFTNVAGTPFSAFKLQKGDIVKLSADGIDDTYAAGDTYLIASNDNYKLIFADEEAAATAMAAGTTAFKIINAADYISIAGASAIGSQRVSAYLVECVQN